MRASSRIRAEHLIDGRGTPVYATTLDEVAPKRIDVLKIDVEGAEFRVVEGGRTTIERDKPLIVMEFSCEMSQRVSGVDPGPASGRARTRIPVGGARS